VRSCGLPRGTATLPGLKDRVTAALAARREASKVAELLLPRHENALLRRQAGRVCYRSADRLWLAALSKLIPRPLGRAAADATL